MPPRPPRDRDSAAHYEPLRASVLDAFQQLGAFDDDSGIVEWIFPEVHEQKQLQRARVKLPEVVEVPEPEPEEPRKSRSRFFGIGSRSRSKSRARKEKEAPPPTSPAAPKQKPKKSRSSPNLRKDAKESAPGTPIISSPMKQTAIASPEQKSRRISIFPRRAAAQSLDEPRPSISDEEWQQITMTGSIADYETNPFLGHDPHASNDAGTVKRDGLQKHFSRFTGSFTRSTPTSPIREQHPTSPTSPLSRMSDSTIPTSDPTTPTRSSPPMPTSPTTEHLNASTSTIPAAPASPPPEIQEVHREDAEVPGEDALETGSQMDHPRTSLSDISEGEVSESSTLSTKSSRESHASTQEES
ncbi:hypothetical protein C8R44DRAFT_187048 [Mycena epipterygia]|nr:hypothetical protein C8R44DRAFT_187048 [Mycena epipterygia]